MGKLVTEMLKGTLEGIVLAILSGRATYGYEITAWLREKGFSDIAEGTVYTLLIRIEQRGLVDVEKIPSEKGPPRKVYSLNAQGQDYLEEVWRTWSFLTEQLEQLPKEADSHVRCRKKRLDLEGDRRQEALEGLQKRAASASRELPRGGRSDRTVLDALRADQRDSAASMFEDLADLFEQAAADATPIREIVGEDPVEFVDAFARTTRRVATSPPASGSGRRRHRARRRRRPGDQGISR